jgi:hypothetical protein
LEDTVVQCAARAGHEIPLRLPPRQSGEHRLDVLLTWRRIRRRVAAARQDA